MAPDQFGSYLHNRVASRGRLHRAPAPLGLIVSSVVRLGLHLDVELVLVRAVWDRPFQRWEGSHWDARERGRDTEEERDHGNHYERLFFLSMITSFVLDRLLIYLQMLETSGFGQIGGITKKGSAAGLLFMSWSHETK